MGPILQSLIHERAKEEGQVSFCTERVLDPDQNARHGASRVEIGELLESQAGTAVDRTLDFEMSIPMVSETELVAARAVEHGIV